MKIVLILLILLHGAVHFMGFFKASRRAKVQQFNHGISRADGLLWLATGCLLLCCAVLFTLQVEMWWVLSCIAIIFSEYLIIKDWQDAKFGTVINIIIFLATFAGFIAWFLARSHHSN